MNSWDVIIAGAGIIGVSIALELRQRGAKVLVLDRGQPGQESSSAAAGMLAATDPETPVPLRALARESARLYPEFVQKLESASGIKVDFRRHGAIALELETTVPAEYHKLSAEQLHRIEPAIKTHGCSAFLVAEDTVDPFFLMKAALRAAELSGVEIRSGFSVDEMRSSGTGVEVAAHTHTLSAKSAVNCRGAWSGAPVKPRKGQMLYLQPTRAGLLQHVVRAPGAYIVPRSTGKVLVGATVEDKGFDKTVEANAIHDLHASAAHYVPDLASATITESWAGLRPGSPDDLPLLGATETPGVFLASGHFRNGILLAPVTAKIMADLILDRRAGMDIAAFAPSRFARVTAH